MPLCYLWNYYVFFLIDNQVCIHKALANQNHAARNCKPQKPKAKPKGKSKAKAVKRPVAPKEEASEELEEEEEEEEVEEEEEGEEEKKAFS